MMILCEIFGWVALAILLGGACGFVRHRLHLGPCFAPVVTVCTLALAVYFGGILGCLFPVTVILYGLCAVATVFELRHRKENSFALNRRPLLEIVFAIGAIGFAGILFRENLTHYDNFSHWGVVVKEMLITNAIPGADSVLLEFTNYPTGTASWIYFVCLLVGRGEHIMIMAQAILIFAAIYSIFGVIQERGRFLLILVLATGLCMLTLFNYTVRINDLLVDFVLPVLSLSTISVIYRHRQEPKLLLAVVVPILGLLLVVKNIGLIYAIVALVYMFLILVEYNRHQTHFLPKLWVRFALAVVLILLPWILWNIHVDQVFVGMDHKFQTDLGALAGSWGGKTTEEVAQICNLFWRTITDVSQRATIGILVYQVVAMVGSIVACGFLKKKWHLPKVLITMDVVLVFYYVGILAMYILSMPMDEAIYLAGLDRYAASIVILFGGVLTITATLDMERSFYYRVGENDEICNFKSIETKLIYLRSCLGCVIVMALLLTSEYNGMMAQTKAKQDSLPVQFKTLVGDNWDLEVSEDRYLVVANDTNGQVSSEYLEYIARYYLRANQVDTICEFYEDNLENLVGQYDYLVVVDVTEETGELMEKYLGLEGKPGVYKL